MNLFVLVKAAVTTRQAAEYYGLTIKPSGMTCCPFHRDKSPSMKVDERYYCFGCHETGDVIDFTAKLFGLSPYDAAMKLAADFGIDPHTPMAAAMKRPIQQKATRREQEGRCASVLIDYERLLKERQARFAPRNRTEAWDGRFASACHSLPQVSYLIDCLYDTDAAHRAQAADAMLQDDSLDRIRVWVQHHTNETEVDPYAEEPRAA